MRFGKTLHAAIYGPWKEHYIDYSKLKKLLREPDDESDSEQADGPGVRERQRESKIAQEEWTENDESIFVEELVNVQLERVHAFQEEMSRKLRERTEACETKLEKFLKQGVEGEVEVKGKDKDDGEAKEEHYVQPLPRLSKEEAKTVLKESLKELDDISFHINKLQKFNRINFTGFLKAAKKHDRRTRAFDADGKGKKRQKEEGGLKVRPLLQVRLSALEFNKEVYSPLLYRLSAMYDFVRRKLEDRPEGQPAVEQAPAGTAKHYTSHKFWIHPDNYLEVKSLIVRRLPVLVYNPKHTKQIDVPQPDPTITSLYFDNPKFSLYSDKVDKKPGAASLRLRWYGQLSSKPDIHLERKTMQTADSTAETSASEVAAATTEDSEGAIEERIIFKDKYVDGFIHGEYSMEKTIQKMRDRQDVDAEDLARYEARVKDFQAFIKENDLQPMLRAVYNRTAFQIPGDDSIRVSLDTNLALIREDSLDPERPCRDPDDWHRKDIDDAGMEYPFASIRKGEIHRFPYALLEIKVLDGLPTRSVRWVYELMSSHLVQEAPRFSKFVHGIATLFEDYVNTFPFWLGEMDKDIRKDPESAWQQFQARRAKQVEEEHAVGSLKLPGSVLGKQPGSFTHGGLWPSNFMGTGTPERTLKLDDPSYGTFRPGSHPKRGGTSGIEAIDENLSEQGGSAEHTDDQLLERFDPTNEEEPELTGLLELFPGFSTSRYARRHRKMEEDEVQLPPGVTKPKQLLMHSTPVNVEPKVWLANQRTFIKWCHISILLATLSLGLYNAAGEHNIIARVLGLVYTAIALFTGAWGYYTYIERSNMIKERSGQDFDRPLGPVIICLALCSALIMNFIFKYPEGIERYNMYLAELEASKRVDLLSATQIHLQAAVETAVAYVVGAEEEL